MVFSRVGKTEEMLKVRYKGESQLFILCFSGKCVVNLSCVYIPTFILKDFSQNLKDIMGVL